MKKDFDLEKFRCVDMREVYPIGLLGKFSNLDDADGISAANSNLGDETSKPVLNIGDIMDTPFVVSDTLQRGLRIIVDGNRADVGVALMLENVDLPPSPEAILIAREESILREEGEDDDELMQLWQN